MRTHLLIIAVIASAAVACKARNHADAGLLDAGSASLEGERFDIRCAPVDNGAEVVSYELEVATGASDGAVSEALRVRLSKVQGAAALVLNVDETASGTVSPDGAVNIAFTGGALSADKGTDAGHVGILTVFGDPAADALDVTCLVSLRDPRG